MAALKIKIKAAVVFASMYKLKDGNVRRQ